MNARTFPLILMIAAAPPAPDFARAESLDAQQKALKLITDTADRICNVVSTRGEANSSEVMGNVTAQLRGLASALADAGVSGTGSITSEQYQNVFRSDLAATLKDNAACKLKVFDTLQNKLLGSGSSPAPMIPKPRTDINITRDFFAGRWEMMQKDNISSSGSTVDYRADGTFTGYTTKFVFGFGQREEVNGRWDITKLSQNTFKLKLQFSSPPSILWERTFKVLDQDHIHNADENWVATRAK